MVHGGFEYYFVAPGTTRNEVEPNPLRDGCRRVVLRMCATILLLPQNRQATFADCVKPM